jgi:quercetin dioxygenase-like cupin family protein
MKRFSIVLAVIGVTAAATVGARAWQAAQPTFTRTQLQDHPLTAKGWHAVQSRSDFQPGAASGKHTHPGEEIGYLLEGTLELTIEGKAPMRLKAGDAIFTPANTVHEARNVGTTTARVLVTYVLEAGKPIATPVK